MATKQKQSKKQQKSDMQAKITARERIPRTLRTTRGVTNIPVIGEIGSAAYRRIQAKKNKLLANSRYGRESKAL